MIPCELARERGFAGGGYGVRSAGRDILERSATWVRDDLADQERVYREESRPVPTLRILTNGPRAVVSRAGKRLRALDTV